MNIGLRLGHDLILGRAALSTLIGPAAFVAQTPAFSEQSLLAGVLSEPREEPRRLGGRRPVDPLVGA